MTRIGTWWGTNPERREETDIDVVGLDPKRKEAVIGECKFRHEITDRKVYEALKERHHLLHEGYRVVQYLLYSASAFSDWLIEEAKEGTVQLIQLQDLYS